MRLENRERRKAEIQEEKIESGEHFVTGKWPKSTAWFLYEKGISGGHSTITAVTEQEIYKTEEIESRWARHILKLRQQPKSEESYAWKICRPRI